MIIKTQSSEAGWRSKHDARGCTQSAARRWSLLAVLGVHTRTDVHQSPQEFCLRGRPPCSTLSRTLSTTSWSSSASCRGTALCAPAAASTNMLLPSAVPCPALPSADRTGTVACGFGLTHFCDVRQDTHQGPRLPCLQIELRGKQDVDQKLWEPFRKASGHMLPPQASQEYGLTCRVRMSSGDVSVRAPITPHMRRPSHLPSSPISSPVRASHACASGQYSCRRYPLSIPTCMTGASSRGSLQWILGHKNDCTAVIYHRSVHHAFSRTG